MARSPVPAALLDKLIGDRAAATAECRYCRVGPVIASSGAATGCNWRVSQIQGAHCAGCLYALEPFIAELRQRFALQPADEMDPSLLTTWATGLDPTR